MLSCLRVFVVWVCWCGVAVAAGLWLFSTALLAVRFRLLVFVLLVLVGLCLVAFVMIFDLVWLCGCDLCWLWLGFGRFGVDYGD